MKKLTVEEIKALSKKERNSLSHELCEKLDDLMYADPNKEWDEVYAYHQDVEAVIDEIYREENYEAFRKYELRMNESDFDWGFYSDWHKDMYGYRPHKEVIPADDDERHQIFEDWHRARGL